MGHLKLVKPCEPSGPRKRRPVTRPGSPLTAAQQTKVKAAIRNLRIAYGGWGPLAEVMGLPYNQVYRLVRPKHKISGDTLLRTCKAGALSVDAMLNEPLTNTGRCASCGARRVAS